MATVNIDPTDLISKLWNAISQRRGYFSNPENKIRVLREAMQQLEAIRNDVNNHVDSYELRGETRRQVRQLLDSVSSIEGAATKIVHDYEQCRCLGGCSINFWCINRRATRKLARVVALRKETDKLTDPARLPPPRVQGMSHTSDLLGMSSYLDKVRTYLNDDHVGIVGIWGMGGVGKTSLLHCINNVDFFSHQEGTSSNSVLGGRRSAMFDLVIWATVYKENTVMELQKQIAKRLGISSRDDERQQATEIFNHLRCRNFLLLLDDLWDKVDLQAVGVPIPSRRPTGQYKHKVVFTTRTEQVCGSMVAHEKMKINCLEPEDAWKLFREMVGQDTLKSHPKIQRLARQVFEECRGLPLALTVIGKAMSTRKTPNEWQDAIALLRRSKLPEILEKDEDMLPRLKLSYDYLPDDDIRKCFSLCALWPKEHHFGKIGFIECWMGHGLIDVGGFNDINVAYDRGHAIIGKLKSACLLEPGFHEDHEVEMHDIIGDMARWIASDEDENNQKLIVQSGATFCREDLNVWATARHVSLINCDIREFPGAPPECPNLVTLILHCNRSLELIPGNFFLSFPVLTYLDLSWSPITELPPEISRAKNLQYLNLSHTGIRRLPESLRCLTKLKFLLLRRLQHLTEIPPGVIPNLSMLEVLDLFYTRCEDWVELEARTKGLKALGITVETVRAIERLSQLHHVMMWRLLIRKLPDLRQPDHQLLLSNFLGSHNMSSSLEQLGIEDCETLEELMMEKGSETAGHGGDIVGRNWCLPKLEYLGLLELPELKKISWRGLHPSTFFPTLSKLSVCGCHNLKNVTLVLKLECLEVLMLANCKEMERLIDDVDEADAAIGPAFPILKRIYLSDLPSLTVIRRSQSTFPSLELLYVSNCPALRSLPFNSDTPKTKLRIHGEPDWWRRLEWTDANLESSLQPCFRQHPVV